MGIYAYAWTYLDALCKNSFAFGKPSANKFIEAILDIFEHRIDKHKANLLRQGMLNSGLEFLIAQKDMCSVLTTVHIPSHIDIDIFLHKLREKSIIVYEGKGSYKGKVFQVGNIGELSFTDINFFLNTQAEILRSFSSLEIIKPVLVHSATNLITNIKSKLKEACPIPVSSV